MKRPKLSCFQKPLQKKIGELKLLVPRLNTKEDMLNVASFALYNYNVMQIVEPVYLKIHFKGFIDFMFYFPILSKEKFLCTKVVSIGRSWSVLTKMHKLS